MQSSVAGPSLDNLPAYFSQQAIRTRHTQINISHPSAINDNLILFAELTYVSSILIKLTQPFVPMAGVSAEEASDYFGFINDKRFVTNLTAKIEKIENRNILELEMVDQYLYEETLLRFYFNFDVLANEIVKFQNNQKAANQFRVNIVKSTLYLFGMYKALQETVGKQIVEKTAKDNYLLQHLDHFSMFARDEIFYENNLIFLEPCVKVEKSIIDNIDNHAFANTELITYFCNLKSAVVFLHTVFNEVLDKKLQTYSATRLNSLYDKNYKVKLPKQKNKDKFTNYNFHVIAPDKLQYVNYEALNAMLAAQYLKSAPERTQFFIDWSIRIKRIIRVFEQQLIWITLQQPPLFAVEKFSGRIKKSVSLGQSSANSASLIKREKGDLKSIHEFSDLFAKKNILALHANMTIGNSSFPIEDNFTLLTELRFAAYFLIKTLKTEGPHPLKAIADKIVRIEAKLANSKTFGFNSAPEVNYTIFIVKAYLDLDKLAQKHAVSGQSREEVQSIQDNIIKDACKAVIFCDQALTNLLTNRTKFTELLENQTLAEAHIRYFQRFFYILYQ